MLGLTLGLLPVTSQRLLSQAVPETAGIKFPDFKSAGVTLRSQRVRVSLPSMCLGPGREQERRCHVLQVEVASGMWS